MKVLNTFEVDPSSLGSGLEVSAELMGAIVELVGGQGVFDGWGEAELMEGDSAVDWR